ncbi:hypothetical protein EVG20_g3472 [Dentipellis fragilis]|uniref:Uncharacterized protein n=1 Tax=Dentipellis fragilis TaxID=205917 RepID=A0A4Y9Z3T5_9AGAM|nr:hypothetical protein EVG20_g3472 [Dentipellis fragilis]
MSLHPWSLKTVALATLLLPTMSFSLHNMVLQVMDSAPQWSDKHAALLYNACRHYFRTHSVDEHSFEDKDREQEFAQKEEEEESEDGEVPHQFPNQMQTEGPRLGEENEMALLPPSQIDPAKIEAAQKHTEVLRRGTAILLEAENPPVKPMDLVRLLLDKPPNGVKFAVFEDQAALARSYRGFEPPETNLDWGTFHDSSDAAARSDLWRLCGQSLELVNASVEDRLVTRHTVHFFTIFDFPLYLPQQFLMRDPTGCRWLLDLVGKVEALLYHRGYDERSRGKGGRAWRNTLIARQFQEWLKNQPDWAYLALLDGEARTRDPKFEEATKTFVRLRTHGGRSRAHLTLLYLQLGPAVLLDPTWDSDNVHFHRSKAFSGVLGYLSDYPNLPVENTAKTLVALGRYLGGPVVAEYLSKFLAVYPSRPAQADQARTDVL